MATQDRFVLTSEQWNEAHKTAFERHSPLEISSAAAAIFGFFGGGILALMTLLLAGLDPQVFPASAAMLIVSIACGVIGYFFFRAKEVAKEKLFREILDQHRQSWEHERASATKTHVIPEIWPKYPRP